MDHERHLNGTGDLVARHIGNAVPGALKVVGAWYAARTVAGLSFVAAGDTPAAATVRRGWWPFRFLRVAD